MPTGATVYAHDTTRPAKFDVMYEDLYQVSGLDNRGSYVLKDSDGKLLTRHFTIKQLKPAAKELFKEEDQHIVFTVDCILDHCDIVGGREYLVHWKGKYKDTWEDQEIFIDWNCINAYCMSKTKPASGGQLRRSARKTGSIT